MLIQRTKGKLNADYKAEDMYKYYTTMVNNPVSYQTYRLITKFINKLVVTKIINENFIFVMPFRTGNLSVRKYKMQLKEAKTVGGTTILNIPVDWKETKKLWEEEPDTKGKKVVYIDNEHSNGYRYKFQWNVYNANFKNKKTGGFKPLRKISRQLASVIKNNDSVDYYEFVKRF